MADEIPSYQKKKYVEFGNSNPNDTFIEADLGYLNSIGNLRNDLTINEVPSFGLNGPQRDAIQRYKERGLGSLQVGTVKDAYKTPESIAGYGLGKAYSVADYVKRYAGTDPNFDPNDETTVNAIAKDIESRGLDPQKNKEDVQTFITQKSIGSQIDRATNPGKYLSEEKKTANTATAERLLKQTFGDDFSDGDLQQFLTDRLAEGESAFEVAQFLKTTPDYQKRQADVENQRVATESQAARQSLDAELLKSEEETFARATPNIIGSYMKAGRLNSSGFDSALTKARADLAKERQGFLANAAYQDSIRSQGYRREDFVGGNAQAFNSYLRQNEPAYQQRFALQGAGNQLNFQQPYQNLARQYSLNDQNRARQYEIEDYDRQQSDFNRYLSDSKKQSREAALYGLLGAGISGGIQGWAMRDK